MEPREGGARAAARRVDGPAAVRDPVRDQGQRLLYDGPWISEGARLLETVAAAPGYRLFALPDTDSAKPGMVGGGPSDGTAIELELWDLPPEGFGRLVAGVPAPLVIGTVVLADGRAVKGLVCEAAAVAGAREITAFGGWQAYRASLGLAGAAIG